jgi:uncharacterized membrane protein
MDRPPPPTSPRLLDPHFRWRASSSSRLEGFADAVFAIVLALLFLRAAPPESFGDLRAAMKALVPFAASFAIIAYVWVEHWLYSRRYDLHDGWSTFLQLLLLFLLLFYAYPLKFLMTLLFVSAVGPIGSLTAEVMRSGYEGMTDAVRLFVFYGTGYGAIFLVLALLYDRARRLEGRLGLDAIERLLTRAGLQQMLVQAAVAGVSIALALTGAGIEFGLPGWVYCAIGPTLAVHGVLVGRRLGQLTGD